MKKCIMRWWVILATLLVVYNVIVFAVPFPKNEVFYISWVFTLIAMGAQIYVIYTSFYQQEPVKSKSNRISASKFLYGFPIAKIGVGYLVVQIVLSFVFMGLGLMVSMPVWIPLVLYVILSAVAIVSLISAETTRDEIVQQDVRLRTDVSRMRALQSKMASIVRLAQDDAARTSLEKFAEDIHYSDPVSSDSLQDIEADLTACVDEIQRAMADGDTQGALVLVQKAQMLLAERNRLCKLGKHLSH